MRTSDCIVGLLILSSSAFAIPLTKRQVTITDADILNYALTLEHLEDKFYREGLANFSAADFAAQGYDETVYANIQKISAHETEHVKFLTDALTAASATPAPECTYSFGVTSLKGFLATASVLEGVGTSAYLGAAASIATKAYLTAAGSILTTEARHSSYLRAVTLAQVPFAQSFDDPLDFDEVHTLASPFIVSCPFGFPPIPGVKAFPALSIGSDHTTPITAGSTVTLTTQGYVLKPKDNGVPLYAAFITVTGPVFAQITSGDRETTFGIVVPEGVAGQSYAVLCNCNETVSDDTIVAGPALIEIGD